MPTNKKAVFRYAVIDARLQRIHRRWSFERLLEEVNEACEETFGPGRGIKGRTLRQDIADMRPGGSTGYDAPIEFDPERGYYYAEPGYSISNSPLSLDDLPILQQALINLRQLLGLGLSEELQQLVRRLENRVAYAQGPQLQPLIHFETVPDYHGLPWLSAVYQAVRSRQVIELTYQPFHVAEARQVLVHPYLLKQYNHRWFLLGLNQEKECLHTFALDRIQHLQPQLDAAFRPGNVNPTTYFEHIIGSSIPQEVPLETIHLWFSSSRGPYIRTKPLHPSQVILSDTVDGLKISLTLIPTRELLTLLLGFGADMRIIAPQSLQQELISCLLQSLDNYRQTNSIKENPLEAELQIDVCHKELKS